MNFISSILNFFKNKKIHEDNVILPIGMNADVPEYAYLRPMFKCRFRASLPDDAKIHPFWIERCSLPRLVNMEWQKVEIVFIDIVGEHQASKMLYDYAIYLRKHMKHPLSRIVLFEKTNNETHKFYFQIEMLGERGTTVQKWIITSNDIPDIDFGEADYYENNFKTCKMTIFPSDCVLI